MTDRDEVVCPFSLVSYRTRAVCPSVLLRVPRALRSSLTSAEHPGKPLFGFCLYLRKNFLSSNGHGVSAEAKSRRSPKGVRDMGVSRCAVTVANQEAYYAASYRTKV